MKTHKQCCFVLLSLLKIGLMLKNIYYAVQVALLTPRNSFFKVKYHVTYVLPSAASQWLFRHLSHLGRCEHVRVK